MGARPRQTASHLSAKDVRFALCGCGGKLYLAGPGELAAVATETPEESMNGQACYQCFYFQPHTIRGGPEFSEGFCKRYPPQLVPNFPPGPVPVPDFTWGCPITMGCGWCGEFKPEAIKAEEIKIPPLSDRRELTKEQWDYLRRQRTPGI